MRQFEFVQEAWLYGAKFDGLGGERDPLTGGRTPLADGAATDRFSIPRLAGVRASGSRACRSSSPCAGGAYFFMPGIRALRFIAGSGG